MKYYAIERRTKHLNSIITWCKVIAGFILIVFFKQESDQDKALNQAIAIICVITISFYIFSAIVAWYIIYI